MTPLLSDGPLSEHCGYPHGLDLGIFAGCATESWESIFFKGLKDRCCLELRRSWAGSRTLHASYYVGTDWLEKGKLAIYIEPKLNNETRNTDYFKMLFEGLSSPGISEFIPGLFEMKMDEPGIVLPQQLDLLTPLLIYQFLQVLQTIVRKGLKKSYQHKVENLKNRVKGKILVSQQIKQNVLRHRPLNTVCSFHEFDVDGLENRILKKALQFAVRYLDHCPLKEYLPVMEKLVDFARPAFEHVLPLADLNDIKQVRINPFFKEYREGIRLAELIFRRYGYNINTVPAENGAVKVPPFWIDMSKLYELYVYAKLRDQPYRPFLKFQQQGKYGRPDFLLCLEDNEIILDAKYKPSYDEQYLAGDIRQLSGYARDTGILTALGLSPEISPDRVVSCLIIYPEKAVAHSSDLRLEHLLDDKIASFTRFFKKSIELPFVRQHPAVTADRDNRQATA